MPDIYDMVTAYMTLHIYVHIYMTAYKTRHVCVYDISHIYDKNWAIIYMTCHTHTHMTCDYPNSMQYIRRQSL